MSEKLREATPEEERETEDQMARRKLGRAGRRGPLMPR